MLRVLKVQRVVIQRNGQIKPVGEITDRAKRYRAQGLVKDRRCFACGNPRARDIHHLDGREENGAEYNLARCCRSCNVRIANVMRKSGHGRLTIQYNPKRRSAGSKSLGAYLSAIQIVKGDTPGNVSSAVKDLQATSHSQRSSFAKRIWEIRRERYGPTGRYKSAQEEIPF